MSIQKRIKNFYSLSSHLASLSPKELQKILKKTEVDRGWGVNHVIQVASKKIFVKRIPLTKLEFEQTFSTKNLFNLPSYYNYGVGSAGFGAFRELLTHIKTTNWVLNKEIENFPLMYHYRIIEKTEKIPSIDGKKHKDYIKSWADNKNINDYVLARKKAKYEVVLFLEYFPFTVNSWILKNTDKYQMLVSDMKSTTAFLQKKGVVHFDLHLRNILTDGRQFYATDFGLCLDKNFELSMKEKKFLKLHMDYDYKEFLAALGGVVPELCNQMSKRNKLISRKAIGLADGATAKESFATVIRGVRKIGKLKCLKADSEFLEFIHKNKETIISMRNFFFDLREDSKKKVSYNNKV